MNFWKMTTDSQSFCLNICSTKGGLSMSLEARHIEDEIYLKGSVVFFQTDKSRTTKVQFHSDPALILKVSAKYVGRQYQRRHLSLTERGA